jgi:hypothetical protein
VLTDNTTTAPKVRNIKNVLMVSLDIGDDCNNKDKFERLKKGLVTCILIS